MKDLSEIQRIVIKALLKRPNVSAEDIALLYGLPEEGVKQCIKKLCAEGWIETRYVIPGHRLASLGYGQKYQFELCLDTHATDQKHRSPESLATEVYAKLKNDKSLGKVVALGPMYLVFKDRIDACFCLRCEGTRAMEEVKKFFMGLPGVSKVHVKMLVLS